MQQSVERVAATLGIAYCGIWERIENSGSELQLRAAVGWQEEAFHTKIPVLPNKSLTFLLLGAEDVASDLPFGREGFEAAPLLLRAGCRSGMAAGIPNESGFFGAIACHDVKPRTFSTFDLQFVQSVGNLLAHAFQLRTLMQRQQELLRRIMQLQEAERQRIAQELHDECSQLLTSIIVLSGVIEQNAGTAEARETAVRVQQLAINAIESVSRISKGLRPSTLNELGIEAALRTLVSEFAADHQIRLNLSIECPSGQRYLPQTEIAVYRIVQEALTNIAKHAHCRSLSVAIHDGGGHLHVSIRDDGDGFDMERTLTRAAAENRLGIAGIRERAAALRGNIVLHSAPGQGTELEVQIPLDSAEVVEEGA